MADFRVRRGVTLTDTTTEIVTLSPALVGLSSAFERVTNVHGGSGGRDAGDADNNHSNADLSCHVSLASTTLLAVSRDVAGESEYQRVAWEIVEYTGVAGGPNEFVVRKRQEVAFGVGIFSVAIDLSSAGIVDADKVGIFQAGCRNGDTTPETDRRIVTTSWNPSTKTATFARTDATSASSLRIVAVEFTGSNWSDVQWVTHTFTAAGVDESETIGDVGSWARTMIVPSRRSSLRQPVEVGHVVRPGASTTTLRFRLDAGSSAVGSPHPSTAWLVSNSQMYVQHLDSVTGGESQLPLGSSSPLAVDVTVGQVVLDHASVIATAAHSNTTPGDPRGHWNYRLKNTTTVEFWVARHGSNQSGLGHWAAQVIHWPQVIDPDPTELQLVVPAVALGYSVQPQPVELQLVVPDVTATVETFVQPDPVELQLVVPGATVQGEGLYPALPLPRWRVERNPNYPTQPNAYRVVNLLLGQTYNSDVVYGLPLMSSGGGGTAVSVLCDAIRRAQVYDGEHQVFELDSTGVYGFVSIGGGGKTTSGSCGYWADGHSTSGPFRPVRNITLVSDDPQVKPRLRRMTCGRVFRNAASQNVNPGPLDEVRFQHLAFYNDGGGSYCWNTPLGQSEVNGMFRFYDVALDGDTGQFNGRDTFMGIRAAFASWDIRDMTCVSSVEHCLYTDAPQGLQYVENLRNLGPAGKTFMQVVQRADPQDGIYGGPPGYGLIHWKNCVATGVSDLAGGSAYTAVGFLGTVWIDNCQAIDCHGGLLAVWGDWGKGIHSTTGTYIGPPPPGGEPGWQSVYFTSHHTLHVMVDGLYGNMLPNAVNPRNLAVIAGTQLVEIGDFDLQGNRMTWHLDGYSADVDDPIQPPGRWNTSGPTNQGPMGSAAVRFITDAATWSGNTAINLSGGELYDFAGFGAGGKVRYGPPNHPDQSGTNGNLTRAEVNALEGINGAYPPWGSGVGQNVLPDAVELQLVVPSVTVTAEGIVEPEPVELQLTVPTVVVDNPVPAGADFLVQRGHLDFGPSAESMDVTLATPVPSLASAFAMLTDVQNQATGPAAGTTSDRSNTQLGVTCELVDTSTLRLTRRPSAVGEVLRTHWQVVAYTGLSGGPNEFVVRHRESTNIPSGENSASVNLSAVGITNTSRVGLFLQGVSGRDDTPEPQRSRVSLRYLAEPGQEDADTSSVLLQRADPGGPSGSALLVAWCAVEFTGTNWSDVQWVSQAPAAPGTDEQVAVQDVGTWHNTMLVSTFRGPENALRGVGWTVRPGADTSTVLLRVPAGATVSRAAVELWLVSNPEMFVDHLDSITGGYPDLPAGGGGIADLSVQAQHVVDLVQNVAVLATSSTPDDTPAQPRGFWHYRYNGGGWTRFVAQRSGIAGEFALQVVQLAGDLPVVVLPDPAELQLTVPDVAVDAGVRPDPVRLVLTVPAVTVVAPVNVQPSPVQLRLMVPAVAVDVPVELAPEPVELQLVVGAVNITAELFVQVEPVGLALAVTTPGVEALVVAQPDPVELQLAVPDVAALVELTVEPDPAELQLVVPAVAVDVPVELAPDPVELQLAVPDVAVEVPGLVQPDPVELQLAVPPVSVATPATIVPLPVRLGLRVPAVSLSIPVALAPQPVVLQLAVPAVAIDLSLTLRPAPVVLQLAVPAVAVDAPGVVLPDPVALHLAVPDVAQVYVGPLVLLPEPVRLVLRVPGVQIAGIPAELVTFDLAVVTLLEFDLER